MNRSDENLPHYSPCKIPCAPHVPHARVECVQADVCVRARARTRTCVFLCVCLRVCAYARACACGIQDNKSVTRLDLANNQLKDAGALHIAVQLTHTYRILTINSPTQHRPETALARKATKQSKATRRQHDALLVYYSAPWGRHCGIVLAVPSPCNTVQACA